MTSRLRARKHARRRPESSTLGENGRGSKFSTPRSGFNGPRSGNEMKYKKSTFPDPLGRREVFTRYIYNVALRDAVDLIPRGHRKSKRGNRRSYDIYRRELQYLFCCCTAVNLVRLLWLLRPRTHKQKHTRIHTEALKWKER